MKNLMPRHITERYAEYFTTIDPVEQVAKTIYYWAMGTLESIFWGLGLKAALTIDLYANEKNIFLLFKHPTGEDYEFVYYFTRNCSDGKLPEILRKFVEIFNTYDYPLSDKISSPVFHANYCGKQDNNGNYKDYEYVMINVDMRPCTNLDNHGRH